MIPGDSRAAEAVGIGTIQMNMLFKVSNSKKVVMYDVLHVPSLSCNLFSVRAAAKRGTQLNLINQDVGSEGPREPYKE